MTPKSKPILFSTDMVRAILNGSKSQTRRVVKPQPEVIRQIVDNTIVDTPYRSLGKIRYEVGDVLWVRETWFMNDWGEYFFRADGTEFQDGDGFHFTPKWKPSIFMPKDICRIKLLIKSIRVERLQDISEEDAKAEGVLFSPIISYREGYEYLWESINGPGSWQANPYVWVLEFSKL